MTSSPLTKAAEPAEPPQVPEIPDSMIAQAAAVVAGNEADELSLQSTAAASSDATAAATQQPSGTEPAEIHQNVSQPGEHHHKHHHHHRDVHDHPNRHKHHHQHPHNGETLAVPATETTNRPQATVGHDAPIESVPPPPYSDNVNELDIEQNGFGTRAKVADDGRVNINIKGSRRLSTLLNPALRSQLNLSEVPGHPDDHPPGYIPPSIGGEPGQDPPPPLNVVMHVVGSRGDVQPFVALGKTLQSKYGHRVRLATHPTFRKFVEENGLEFFSIGGDPAELMAFMVKNPGLMPGFESLRSGDVGARRKGIYEIVKGCWRSCFEAGDGMGVEASDDLVDDRTSFDSGIFLGDASQQRPFVADAIIANPPSFAHIHCAEKLGIPLHIMFTMPWSPTQAFPHPLANIQSSNADTSITNFMSYALVEMMTWQGLGDVINRFREKSLGLEPVSLMWAPGMASRLRIPFTYCWSPALIPKPKDWGHHISISGFFFLSLASSYTPEPDLQAFLDAGPPPVYIGFGSIVVDDPDAMTKMIFEAIKKTGVRALVSKGWGGLGANEMDLPEGVFMLGNVPHDWLFQHVSCVVHHGGAGTTAAGVALGKPTVVVPFFGDQPFWGAMIAKAGAGPTPIPYKHHTADTLAESILEALQPAALDRAKALGARIASEDGSVEGARYFHNELVLDKLRCSLAPSRVAVWRVKRTRVRLSSLAAIVLGNAGLLNFSDLKLYRPREYDSEDGPWDPISGGASALLGTLGSLMMGVADFPVEILKALTKKSDEDGSRKSSLSKEATSPTGSATTSKKAGSLADSSTLQSSLSLSSASDSRASGSTTPATQASTTNLAIQDPTKPDEQQVDPKSPESMEMATPFRSLSPTSTDGSATAKATSMAQALNEHYGGGGLKRRSSSPSSLARFHKSHQDCPICKAGLETVISTGKGVTRLVGAGLKSPMDFTLSLARGFHNAPKLYGDKTVRQPDRVTGFQSGLKAAGKELGLGMYDGISGLVTQPYKGAREEGPAGFVKGIGKGIGGVVLKPGAAIWGVPGYTFKGIYKELQKHFGSSVQNYIIAARTAQGYEDLKSASEAEKSDIISRWHAAEAEIVKARQTFADDTRTQLAEFKARQLKAHENAKNHLKSMQSMHTERSNSFKEKHKSRKNKKTKKTSLAGDGPTSPLGPALHHAESFPGVSGQEGDHHRFEEAIKASVSATSRGDGEEDRLIERAIRASVAELVTDRDLKISDDEAFRRAIEASVQHTSHAAEDQGVDSESPPKPFLDNEKGHVEEALRQSLHEHHQRDGHAHRSAMAAALNQGDSEWSDSAIDTDDDENIKIALQASRDNAAAHPDDVELHKALRESEDAFKQHEQKESQAKTEEEIVLEYVRKQSLAEVEHQRVARAKAEKEREKETETVGDESDGGRADHDEELKKAIRESLKIDAAKDGSGAETSSH
ncbi:MAG: hypothetical protein M1825_000505 [Sarcosagium campestre]|nr:MAG: hypothetical protein M1825_000505 [Sarcosagium campestre]